MAKIRDVIEKPGSEGRYLALIERGSYLPFDQEVPRLVDGRPLEQALMHPDGRPKTGGVQQNSVRRLPEAEFTRLIDLGLPQNLEEIEAGRYQPPGHQIAERAAIFHRPVVERLTRRRFRDVAFRRKVREAYDFRCAVSGLRLRNGGGRPEVQAAHIRLVEHNGSDSVRNGIALSATVQWMFDRGLISVAEDNETIMISSNKVPTDVVQRLLMPGGKLCLPGDPRDRPHPANLKWHREHVFGQHLPGEDAPWA